MLKEDGLWPLCQRRVSSAGLTGEGLYFSAACKLTCKVPLIANDISKLATVNGFL